MRGLGAQIKDHEFALSSLCFLPASLVVLLTSLLKYPTSISESLSVKVRCASNNSTLERLSRLAEIKGQRGRHRIEGESCVGV